VVARSDEPTAKDENDIEIDGAQRSDALHQAELVEDNRNDDGAARFKLPGYVGLIRAQLAPLLEKPGEPLYDVTRWFLVAGIVACIIAAVPLIATLILAGG
jgi:hypothetical protein